MIFEVTEPGFPADQAVRIFVEFDRVEEATKVCGRGQRICITARGRPWRRLCLWMSSTS